MHSQQTYLKHNIRRAERLRYRRHLRSGGKGSGKNTKARSLIIQQPRLSHGIKWSTNAIQDLLK